MVDINARAQLQAAEEYAELVTAVHVHKEMLFDYGHSLEKERELPYTLHPKSPKPSTLNP